MSRSAYLSRLAMPKRLSDRESAVGDGDADPALLAAAAELGIETHVLSPGDDPAECVRARRTSSARRAETGRSARSRGSRSSAACRSCACRSGRGTISRATSGLDLDDPVGALAAFSSGVPRVVDVGPCRRPRVLEQRLDRRVRDARPSQRARGACARCIEPERVTIDGAPVARASCCSRTTRTGSTASSASALDSGRAAPLRRARCAAALVGGARRLALRRRRCASRSRSTARQCTSSRRSRFASSRGALTVLRPARARVTGSPRRSGTRARRRRGRSSYGEPADLGEVVAGLPVAAGRRREPREAEDGALPVGLVPRAEEVEQLELEARSLRALRGGARRRRPRLPAGSRRGDPRGPGRGRSRVCRGARGRRAR